uniref:(northern house mosquito) hypothetical protein n=1 Tax=Culex pipiens TaxID=7175 RepID=A0A8D8AHG8_CULPI
MTLGWNIRTGSRSTWSISRKSGSAVPANVTRYELDGMNRLFAPSPSEVAIRLTSMIWTVGRFLRLNCPTPFRICFAVSPSSLTTPSISTERAGIHARYSTQNRGSQTMSLASFGLLTTTRSLF